MLAFLLACFSLPLLGTEFFESVLQVYWMAKFSVAQLHLFNADDFWGYYSNGVPSFPPGKATYFKWC